MCVCVLDREEPIAFSCFFCVVCGQRTVAALCEMKTGLGRGSLTHFGSLDTRNAVAPTFGMLDSGAQISGPKSNPQSGSVCLAPHCLAVEFSFRLRFFKVAEIGVPNVAAPLDQLCSFRTSVLFENCIGQQN